MIPPIVGVPSLVSSSFNPSFLTFSLICLFEIILIILFPNTIENNNESKTDADALNEIYLNMLAPAKLYSSCKNSNKWYNI